MTQRRNLLQKTVIEFLPASILAAAKNLLRRPVTGLLLASFFGIALYLRIALPYDQVFSGDWVKFTGVDAYWHMRIVDNLVHNFPHLNSFDPYMAYPGGGGTSYLFPFFDYLLAGVIWLIGLGSPTEHTIDTVAAYFPAVLGALTVIPVYFIGKTLFDRWAGIIAAALIGILPGEFLGRSILGFTDHHVAEVLFTTTAMLFLILAINSAKREQLTLAHLKHPLRVPAARPLLYGILAGIFLGIYLISWMGALLFVFIITAYFLIQFTIDHLQKRPVDYLCLIGTAIFLPALLISVSVTGSRLDSASLVIALVVPAGLTAMSRLMSSRELKPIYYPLTLVVLGIAAAGVLYAIDSDLLRSMVNQMGIFSWHIGTSNLEMQPLLLPSGQFSFTVVWGNFTTGSFLSLIGLCLLAYMTVRNRGEADKTLLIVWTLVILAATLAQRRFNYYLAVNVALLTGYVSWQVLRFAASLGGSYRPAIRPEPARRKKKSKQKRTQTAYVGIRARWAYVSLAAIVVFFVVLYPNVSKARQAASQTRFAPGDAWLESLSWLTENSTEPFGNADFYYERYSTPFDYPDTAYGVTAWWDYGYWITRVAHRMPSNNPGAGASGGNLEVAKLLVAQDEATASEIMNELGSRYLITDYQIVTGKFHAPVTLSGLDLEDFQATFYYREQQDSPTLRPVTIYFPEYYRSVAVRLHNFGGEAVVPDEIMVISWEWRTSTERTRYREITATRSFPTYEEAAEFVEEQESGNHQIGSPNPFVSPVPLEELEHFELRHSEGDMGGIPEVRAFEYIE